MSGFLDRDTLTALEGRYLKFADGIQRTLRLVSHKTEQVQGSAGPYNTNTLFVIDQQSGEEKEFRADQVFMRRMAAINDQLSEGSVIYVLPKKVGVNAKGYDKFDYEIKLEALEGAAE